MSLTISSHSRNPFLSIACFVAPSFGGCFKRVCRLRLGKRDDEGWVTKYRIDIGRYTGIHVMALCKILL